MTDERTHCRVCVMKSALGVINMSVTWPSRGHHVLYQQLLIQHFQLAEHGVTCRAEIESPLSYLFS